MQSSKERTFLTGSFPPAPVLAVPSYLHMRMNWNLWFSCAPDFVPVMPIPPFPSQTGGLTPQRLPSKGKADLRELWITKIKPEPASDTSLGSQDILQQQGGWREKKKAQETSPRCQHPLVESYVEQRRGARRTKQMEMDALSRKSCKLSCRFPFPARRAALSQRGQTPCLFTWSWGSSSLAFSTAGATATYVRAGNARKRQLGGETEPLQKVQQPVWEAEHSASVEKRMTAIEEKVELFFHAAIRKMATCSTRYPR